MICLSRRIDFSATHIYRIYDWSDEKNAELFGACSNKNGHGHSYQLEVMVCGELNQRSGIVVNINEIDKEVNDLVRNELDGKFLNYEHPYFKKNIPTTENIVKYIWDALYDKFTDCTLYKLRLHESAFLYSEKEVGKMVSLTRKYHFSTAHRLHSNKLNDSENKRIFGKCNNPYGHGHNYYLEVTVKDEPDAITGMVTNLKKLDMIVDKIILQKFDHKHLNLDTAEFKELNPTSENLTIVIWDLLENHIENLHKIGLWETEKNFFEYSR